MSRVDNWKFLIDRFKSKPSYWKANLLLIGAPFTLIKSDLGSLGFYFMSIFKVPEMVLKALESLRASFFWGASKDKKKVAWIKWKNVLDSFGKGDLGIGSLNSFNCSLLYKWGWRLLKNPNALWVKVIKSIHGEETGMEINGCHNNGIWGRIVGLINNLHSSGTVPLCSIRYNVGDGSSVRFWKDIWIGDSPLCVRFNRLFHLEKLIDYLVRDRFLNSLWSWDWHRPITAGRTHSDFSHLLEEIHSTEVGLDGDSCICSLSPYGIVTVSNIRHHIDDCSLLSLSLCTNWCKIGPRKVNIFMWRLTLDRLPHRLNLSSHGLDIPSIMCPGCNVQVESKDHTFFLCNTTSNVWRLIRIWSNSTFLILNSYAYWDLWFISRHTSKESKDRAFVIFAATCWILWRYRNSITFNSQIMRKRDIFDNICLLSFSWLKHR